MITTKDKVQLNESNTHSIIEIIKTITKDNNAYEATKIITRDFLGSHKLCQDKYLFGFWVPGLSDGYMSNYDNNLFLEVLSPKVRSASSLDFFEDQDFTKTHIPLIAINDYLIGVVSGMIPGNEDELGDLYWLYADLGYKAVNIRDPLACSLPFGIDSPAELFELDDLLLNRKDLSYFTSHYKEKTKESLYLANNIGRCLAIHSETHAKEGRIKELTRRLEDISHIIKANKDNGASIYKTLKKGDLYFLSFDSISLSSSLLETLSPQEILSFVETLHMITDHPIQICLDLKLEHYDYLDGYLSGPTYDRDIDFTNDNVKALLIELLRRKIDFGFDCIRIEGTLNDTDKNDTLTGYPIVDPGFLEELVSITQNIPLTNTKVIRRHLDINYIDTLRKSS